MVKSPADIDKWNLLQSRVAAEQLTQTFSIFRREGIEPIVMKGWAAARNYPDGHIRRPGDIDLAVSPGDFPSASKMIREAELRNFLIDLHCGLRQLDSLAWEDLFAHSELVDLDGTPVRVLCPEDHLRILCTHWLIDGGGYKDKLWDIYYAVASRPAEFDWSRCLDAAGPIRRGWVVCAIGIVHKYLGLRIDDLPFADRAARLPSWVTRCVEREWRRPEYLEPILTSIHDRGLLLRQVGRRMPPNPIRATIEAEGDIFGRKRLVYQAQVIARRSGPFLRDTLSLARILSKSRSK